MSILRVANVHFDSAGTNRIDYVGGDSILRVSSGALRLPIGGTGLRPTGEEGLIRYNSDTGNFEGRNATAWGAIAGVTPTSFTSNVIFTVTDNSNAALDIIQSGSADGLKVQGTANIRSLGVGTDASGVLGEIRAANNITAYYSDERLKTVLGTIPNALEKVNSLSGIIYINNEVAESFGYRAKNEQVGVIAQEVEAVLPQIVKLAPFDSKYIDGVETSISGQNYRTVQYDKLVPLLIEAIKELSQQVEELKSK